MPFQFLAIGDTIMHRISESDMPAGGTPGSTRTRGFTIVEILVVVSIFTVLLTLLLPAVNNAREGVRRNACIANQVRLSGALAKYESSNGYLPGVRERIPNVTGTFTWFAMLMPYFNRNDIYSQMQNGVRPNVPLAEAICPSSATASAINGAWLYYGANSGTSGNTGAEYPNRFDGALVDNTGAGTLRQSLTDIREGDGLKHTFLTGDASGFTVGGHNEYHTWNSTGHSGRLGFRNWQRPSPVLNNFTTGVTSTSGARSRHAGGVVLSFCDGRTQFVKEDILPHIWGHITTSRSVWRDGTGPNPRNTYQPVNSGWANYWLARDASSPPASQQPYQVKETDY